MFWVLSYYEGSCDEHLCTWLLVHVCKCSLAIQWKMEDLRSSTSVDIVKQFFKVVIHIYTCTSGVWKLKLLHILPTFGIVSLTNFSYFGRCAVVLICIFLVINKIEHLVVCLLTGYPFYNANVSLLPIVLLSSLLSPTD